jgi:hypothetical protein
MTSAASKLMGLGMPPALAIRLGGNPTSKTGIGTSQASGAPLVLGEFSLLVTAGGNTAFTLPNVDIGDEIEVFNTTSTAALVFPPAGLSANINNGTTDASISLAQNKYARFKRLTATLWMSGLTA